MKQNKIARRRFLTKASTGGTAPIVGKKLSASDGISQSPSVPSEDGQMLKVALLQMTSAMINPAAPRDIPVMDPSLIKAQQEQNVHIAETCCRRAAGLGADIAVFPEMWDIGYALFDAKQPGAREKWAGLAIDHNSAYMRHFISLARELNMAIAVTYLQKWNPAPRNTVSLIDRSGKIVLTYAKVHTCEFLSTEARLTPGDEFPVCELDTKAGPVKVGCMICFDFQFPESARILMLNGAELILTPVATGMPELYRDQVKIRAYDNAVAVALANYANLPFGGNSVAYDAVGELLVQPISNGREYVQIARLNLRELRESRATTIWGDAFRRPRKYQRITADDVAPVFIRKNCYGQPFDRKNR